MVTTTPQQSVARIDVRDAAALREFVCAVEPDVVVHLAAISDVASGLRNPARTFEVNVGGTINLLEAVRTLEKRPRVLLVSSGAVYGDSDSGMSGFTERDIPNPASTYATSKLMSEEVARCYIRDFDLDILIARPFNHTGPGQADSFVCSSFARQIAESAGVGGIISIKTGALQLFRDFTDVRDVVIAYRRIIDKGNTGETYNVCSGSLVRISDILGMLGRAAGCQVQAVVEPGRSRPNEALRIGGNSSKLHKQLGWEQKVDLSETLTELLEFWKHRARVAA
jgi:GDP-4-dehydro-6-deoxy-D-mannose reductase